MRLRGRSACMMHVLAPMKRPVRQRYFYDYANWFTVIVLRTSLVM